jgi:transposase-like protein
MGPATMGREEKRAEFIRLRAKGHSYSQIAERLDVAKGTLSNWNAELEADVAQLKAIELEALHEEYFLLKEGRIRLLGDQLRSIREEVESRDLSDVDTVKLHELMLKYFDELKGEYTEARPLSEAEAEVLR